MAFKSLNEPVKPRNIDKACTDYAVADQTQPRNFTAAGQLPSGVRGVTRKSETTGYQITDSLNSTGTILIDLLPVWLELTSLISPWPDRMTMSSCNKKLGPSDHRSLAELEERHGLKLEGVHLPPCPPLHLLPRLRPPRQLSPARPLRPPRQVSGQGAGAGVGVSGRKYF